MSNQYKNKNKFWQKAKWFVFALLIALTFPIFSYFVPVTAIPLIVAFFTFFIMGIVNLFRGNKNGKREKR